MDPATPEGSQSVGKPRGTNKEGRPGNGGGVKVEGIRFSKKKEGEGNWFDLLLLCTYLVQARGQAGVVDVHGDITTGLKSKVMQKTVSDALEALRKQEILAEAQNADGERVFSVKRYKFNCSPEIAQGPRGVIEDLRSDSTGQLIIERFTKETKDKRPLPEDPADFKVTFVLTRAFLGGQVWAGNDLLQEDYFDAKKYHTLHLKRHERMDGKKLKPGKKGEYEMLDRFADHTEIPCMFERTHDGNLIASHAHSVQNFFRKAIEAFSPSKHCVRGYDAENFFGFTDIEVDPGEQMLTFVRSPVQRNEKGPQSKGAGLKLYEALKAGTELVMEFSCPTKNLIDPKEMKFWLERVLTLCVRSMSPARGDQKGTSSKLKKLEVRRWSAYDEGYQEV